MTTAVEREAKSKIAEERDFQSFMERPETKLMLSLIPPSDNQDALQTLLRAAFHAGSGSGSGEILVALLGAMLKAPKDQR